MIGALFKKISLLIGFFTLLFVGWVVFLLATFPKETFQDYTGHNLRGGKNRSHLEAESEISRAELSEFLLFSAESKSASDYLNEELLKATEANDRLGVVKDIMLPPLLKNDCQRFNCAQYRVSLGEIPSLLWRGLIGIEDYRYLDHFGIDFKSIFRSLLTDIIHMKLVQGGSTLTQQLVKNLFLTQEKSFIRKFKEMIYAIYIEQNYSKEDILNAYFNEVYWGSLQGVYIKGVYSASLMYFGVPPNGLSAYQSVILVSLLKGPGYYSPLSHSDRLKERSLAVYKSLVDKEFLPPNLAWKEENWNSWLTELSRRNKRQLAKSVLYAEKNEKKSGWEEYDRYVFDLSVGRVKEAHLKRIKKQTGEDADLAVKAYFLNVLDLGQEFAYYSKKEKPIGDAIIDERHQIGSIIKPLLYSIFMQFQKSIWDEVSTEPLTLKLKSGEWSPKEDHSELPPFVTLAEALQKSYNRPPVRLAQEIGFERIEVALKDYIPHLKVPLAEYPAQLLGAVELSLSEVLNVYWRFLKEQCQSGESELINILKDPTQTTVRSRARGFIRNVEFFGKTGTTNNGNDGWFLLFDGTELGVIWVGNEGNRNLRASLYGASTSFEVLEGYWLNRGKRFSQLHCPDF